MTRLFFPVLALAFGCNGPTQAKPAASLAEFAARIESLRATRHIHALSAVIAKDQSIVWSSAFGGTDPVPFPVSDTTVFHLASLTKPLASTVILQLVDEGKVSLDDPASRYGIALPPAVLVRHLMSHTSEGVPGTRYAYNGNRFSLLDSVITHASGQSFAEAVQERILAPLGLKHTAPAPESPAFVASGLDRNTYRANFAPGYTWNGTRYVPTAYETHFSTAAGLTASARDYATFSMAMDRDAFLKPATRTLAWTPVQSPSGEVFPYGLGWFATDYKGTRVVWHYGYWTAASALVVKVPSQGLTFVLLANTDGLSSAYPLGSGQLEASPWAREFLETFVVAKVPLP